MENVVVDQVYSASTHGMGVFAMMSSASLIVKIVIFVLLSISVFSWAVMIHKYWLIRALGRQSEDFYKLFWHADTLGKIYQGVYNKSDLYSRLFVQSFDEYQSFAKTKSPSNERAREMRETIDRLFRMECHKTWGTLGANLDFLASIGSATPFIGLLGTVWGIMDSFEQIGITKNASLASVAPGIAEALFTTALGLVVTIPAVIGYNKIRGSLNRQAERIENYSDQLKDLFAKDGSADA